MRKYFVGLLLIIVAVLTIVVLRYYRHDFTVDKWITMPENRHLIINDFLETNELVGMSEEDVVGLLGEEDATGQSSFKGDSHYYPPETTLVYYLGKDYMEGLWLIVSLENYTVSTVGFGVT